MRSRSVHDKRRRPSQPSASRFAIRRDGLLECRVPYGRKRPGLRGALRIVGALYRHMKRLRPDWPTLEEREEDLRTHIRVSAVLVRTAPIEAGRRANAKSPALHKPARRTRNQPAVAKRRRR